LLKVRVRGIYSTALTRLLLDHGFEVVQPSAAIGERFGLTYSAENLPLNLDIYDRFDGQGVHVVGETVSLNTLISILQSSLDDVIVRRRAPYRAIEQEPPVSDSRVEDIGDTALSSQRGFLDVEFPSASKKKLDEIRSHAMPTIDGHHYLKACGGKIASLLEMAENMLEKGSPKKEVEEILREAVMAEYPTVNSKIDIEHVKIDGRVFHLNNAKIVDFDEEEGSLRLQRTFKRSGVYNGLRVRKDPDDYALTDMKIGSWTFRTRYFSRDGQYKGTYVNLNTPVELYPNRIRYVDLEVDVCLWPDGKIEKVDLEKLDDRVSKGYISERLSSIVKARLELVVSSIGKSLRKKESEEGGLTDSLQ